MGEPLAEPDEFSKHAARSLQAELLRQARSGQPNQKVDLSEWKERIIGEHVEHLRRPREITVAGVRVVVSDTEAVATLTREQCDDGPLMQAVVDAARQAQADIAIDDLILNPPA